MMREIKRNTETAFCANTALVTGTATTARVTAGLGTWVATNDDFGSGGVSPSGNGTDTRTDAATAARRAFVESDFKNVLQLAYTQGGNPDLVMLGAFNKQAFSGFSGGATRFDRSEDAKLVATVDIYRSDFGTLRIIPNRFQRARDAWVLDTDYWKQATLRPIQKNQLSKTGDNIKYQILWETGLESCNEASSGLVADLTES